MSEQLINTPGTFGDNGNFLLERELGSGGMGGVYMGRDKMLDRPVAVKVMLREYGSDPEFVEKFKKEAQAAAKLIHPNIAQIYSYGICDGMPYMAMELATGGSLYSIMKANPGKADVTRIIKICQQTAQALQCASDQGCVHGDVKPENILLDSNGNAKLVDFGLAAMQKDTDEIWGTPYYISPEKVKKEPIDFRADMYSLGGTLYHALTGVAPFDGEDAIAVVKKRFDGAPKKPSEIRSDLTPAIDELVMRMLALKPEDRYPSFEALLEAFREVLTNGLVSPTKTGKVSGEADKKAATTSTGARRTAVRGTRAMRMRKGGTTSTIKKHLDDDEDASSNRRSSVEDDEEEEEGGGSLGLKVVGIVVGVIALIGAVAGGLVWYKIADQKAREREHFEQVVGGIVKAREAIKSTVVSAEKFADEFDAFAQRAIDECQKPTDELKKMLPAEQGDALKPGPTQELLDAIAATNVVAEAAPPADTNAVAAAASTNAPPPAAAAGVTNAPAAAAAAPAPAEAAAPAAAAEPPKKAEPPPEVVIAMNDLWVRAYGCQASAIRIRIEVQKLVQTAATADEIKEETRENMEKLAELSRTLVEMLDGIKTSKHVENVRKGITFIKSKGEKTVKQTVIRLKKEKLEAERKAAKEKAEEEERLRKEKEAAEKKAKIEEETKRIKDKFDFIVSQGSFRILDWKSAIRQLEVEKAELKTTEGQLAADLEIRKVNDMKKVHDLFIKHLNGHTFKGHKLRNCKISKIDEKIIELTKPDGRTKVKVSWPRFYKDFPGNLNEVINAYVVNTRSPASKHRLALREWADAVTGAALTMQLVCSEANGAIDRAKALAKQCVSEFPDYKNVAKQIFPDVDFDEETSSENKE